MEDAKVITPEILPAYHDTLVKYKEVAADEKLKEIAEQAAKLTIADENDEDGYKAAMQGRLALKKFATAIEKKRKELKQDTLDKGRAIDAEAERLQLILTPEVLRLTKAIDDIDNIARRKKEAADQEAMLVATNRIGELAAYGQLMSLEDVKPLSEIAYNIILADAKDKWQIKQDQIQKDLDAQAEKDAELARLREQVQTLTASKQIVESKLEEKTQQVQEIVKAAMPAEHRAAIDAYKQRMNAWADKIGRANFEKAPQIEELHYIDEAIQNWLDTLKRNINNIVENI